MRTARAIIAGLALAASVGLAPSSSAQTINTLVNFNATWRYDQSGTDLGTAWRAVGFADGAWASGPGLIQGGEGTAYPVAFGTTINPPGGKPTVYFRTTFQGPASTNGIQVFATNFVDDACVIWLNGVEAGRIRMPAGTPTYATLATGGPAAEGQVDLLTINPALLRPGQQNTLAVEVHQPDLTSSDVVWGMRLVTYVPSALTITAQPQSQTAVAGDSVTFSTTVSGGPAYYQWQKDQVNILNATNASYTISSVSTASAATYRVIVTNAISRLTSSNAVLTVFADTEGPVITGAVVRDDIIGSSTNNIEVTFDEQVNASTTTTNNIRVIRSGTFGANAVGVTISNVVYGGRTLRLRVGGDNWNVRSNYYLLVNNVTDSKGNVIAPLSVFPISFRERTNLIQMGAFWDYYTINAFDPDGDTIYTSNRWYLPSYVADPTYWGRTYGILYADNFATAQTCVGDSLNNDQTIGFQNPPSLFRSTFNFPTNLGTVGPITGTLQLRYMVDDGMILYLNGQEIYRYNVAAGQLTINTRAQTTVAVPTCSTNVEVTVTNLNPRTNYLAAAVVQASGGAADVYFGLELDGVLLRPGIVPTNGPANLLKLTPTKLAGSSPRMQMSWPSNATTVYYGYMLREAFALGNPGSNTTWLGISNQVNGLIVPATNSARFYKLEKGPNSGR